MKKLTKEVKKEIVKYIEDNQPMMYWDYQSANMDTAKTILEQGMDDFFDNLYENNLEYVWELENYLIAELQNEWDEYDPDQIEEFSRDYICVDMNVEELIRQIPDVTCVAYVYSNYDCCNSMDRFEDGGYLPEVYSRVKVGVRKADYMYEFYNGVYGGCVFCFAFKTDVRDALELRANIKTGKEIFIPKGTQYGFFSSFQGAGTPFEKRTYRNMTMPLVGETEYDSIDIMPDILQSYNLSSVYGDTSFVDESPVEIN